MVTKRKKPSQITKNTTPRKRSAKKVRFDAHPYEPITPSPLEERDGSLIVVEGVDGSGKSTQLNLIARWLESNGFAVVQTEWTSSENVRPLIKQIKRKPILIDPRVFSLLYVADVAERVRNIINGALKAGMIVLCDRYVYTALSRDMARGLEEKWVKQIYDFVPRPDIAFYFQVPAEVALSRKTSMPKFYEAGMDIGLSKNPKIAFEIFQRRVIKTYDDIAKGMNFHVIDGSDRIYRTFPKVKNIVATFIKNKYGITLS
jgi:dTMP kinase